MWNVLSLQKCLINIFLLLCINGQDDSISPNNDTTSTVVKTEAITQASDETTPSVALTTESSIVTKDQTTAAIIETTSTMGTKPPFDHTSMWLNIVLDACDLQHIPASVFIDVLQNVEEAIESSCGVSNKVVDATSSGEDDKCLIKIKANDNNGYDKLEVCFRNEPVRITHNLIDHNITAADELICTTPPVPSTSRLLRKRLNVGLDPELIDDDSVVKLGTKLFESNMLTNFEENVRLLNTMLDKITELLNLDKQDEKSLEIIGLNKNEDTGFIELAIRPISTNVIGEEQILNDLKKMVNDPDSPIYNIEGVSMPGDLVTTLKPSGSTTTTSVDAGTTTTMMPSSTTTSKGSSTTTMGSGGSTTTTTTTAESTQNWPLIGGLVGGIGGAAALAGGLGVYFTRRNKNDDALVPENPNQVVLTPNTRHAREGSLVERTPRALTPTIGGGFD